MRRADYRITELIKLRLHLRIISYNILVPPLSLSFFSYMYILILDSTKLKSLFTSARAMYRGASPERLGTRARFHAIHAPVSLGLSSERVAVLRDRHRRRVASR